MTNDNHTRKKANAVFFSVIMVISMVAVGFAGFAGTAAAQNPDPQLDKNPLHFASDGEVTYNASNDTIAAGNGVIELAFNDSVSENTGNVTLFNQAGDEVTNFSLNDSAVDADADSGQVIINVADLEDIDDEGVLPRVGDITVEFDNENDVTSEVRFLGSTITDTDDTNVFEGSQIAFVGENLSFGVEITSDSVFATRSTGENSQVARFNTADRPLEQYNVTGDDEFTAGADFQLRDLGLDIEVDDLEIIVDEDVTGTVSATDSDRDVEVELLDADDEVEDSDTIDLGIDAEADFTLTPESTGDFVVEATDLSSGATVQSDVIEVTEAPDGDIEFDDSFVTVDQGDLAEVTINFEGDQEDAFLRFGDVDEVGYSANVTVDSGGEDSVTLLFNTYAAGTDRGDLVTIQDADDSDAQIVDNPDGVPAQSTDDLARILAQGTYPMELDGQSFDRIDDDQSEDVGDIDIEDRSIGDFNIWTTSSQVFEDVEDEDDILAAAENGTVQQQSEIAQGDVIIHELEATGLDGLFESGLEDSNDALFSDADGFLGVLTEEDEIGADLRIRQTAATTPPNAERKEADLGDLEEDISVIAGDESYYIAFDESDVTFDGDRAEDGEAYNVRLRIKDDRLIDVDPDEDFEVPDSYQVVTTSFSIEEAEGEFDEPVEVEADEGQTISGTTNVAAGNEVTLRVRSASGVTPGFVLTQSDIEVDSDGTFAGEFDFSEASVDDEFTVRTTSSPFADSIEADGVVVEAEEEDPEEEEAFFEVSDLDPVDVTVDQGDLIDVSATITNTGDADGEQTVEFRVGGDTIDSQDVELDVDEDQTVEFTDIDTSDLEGDFEHGVFTDDDSQTGTLTVDVEEEEEPEVDDEEEEVDDEEEEPEVEDDTPGFGAVVALVALIAAALLATRRRTE